MALAGSIKGYNNISVGLITDTTKLQYPVGATTDEDNCTLTDKGNRARRRGIDLEAKAVVKEVDGALLGDLAVATSCSVWEGAGGDNGKDFLIVQIGKTIYLYDLSSVVLSNGFKWSYDFSAYTLSPTPELEEISTASSGGYLYVVSAGIKPFMVSYDVNTDSFSVNDLAIMVRDFKGVEDNLEVDEHPAVLTDEHNYNLLNQGWPSTRITEYFNDQALYPANNEIWYFGRKET